MRTPELLLATLTAKHVHTAFGLRCLLANLGPLESRAQLLEFDINQRVRDIAERILACAPRVLGLGVYVWNVEQTKVLLRMLKQLEPSLVLVVGGPEVSHDIEQQPWLAEVDYVVRGEGEVAFRRLAEALLAGERPAARVHDGGRPPLESLALPYRLYSDADLAHRVVYVEASRGCPYTCSFCLSSLDETVRRFPLEPFLAELGQLLARGLRHFKFVDRTFNVHVETGVRILSFFLERLCDGLFLHFEMIPDRFPEALRALVQRFPPGVLQFEVGIQSFDPEVQARIRRRQDAARTASNLEFLRTETGVHVHADLIAGLPGESLEGFARGFDALYRLGPQEIQVGMLKRLRGTPLAQAAEGFGLVFSDTAPYELLRSPQLDFAAVQRLGRFAKLWDIFANSGRFRSTLGALLAEGSAFEQFQAFTQFVSPQVHLDSGISETRQFRLLRVYLLERAGWDVARTDALLLEDYGRAGHSGTPPWSASQVLKVPRRAGAPRRQQRHAPSDRDS